MTAPRIVNGEKYTCLKTVSGSKTYIPTISALGRRHMCRRAFFRASDAVAYRARLLDRYERLKEATRVEA